MRQRDVVGWGQLYKRSNTTHNARIGLSLTFVSRRGVMESKMMAVCRVLCNFVETLNATPLQN
jgi:hypothetical protein